MASLSRDEWCKMWEDIKYIEEFLGGPAMNRNVKIRIKAIKDMIQSVIGQME